MSRKRSNDELNRLSVEEFKKARKHRVLLVLDNVRSLHNVGSAFRTADAFLIEGIVLCGVTGRPPDREIEKTALGATASVTWDYMKSSTEAIRQIKARGYSVYAIEQAEKSISLNQFKNKGKTALVFGHEVYGVEQEVIDLCDGVIEIPQGGTKHSLNVSVSIGIVLWEILRKKLK